MNYLLKQKLSSITVKLFFWFWLITITSISATRFISMQLAEESVILPPHPEDVRQLHRIVKRISHKKPNSLISFVNKFTSNNDRTLLLKNVKNNKVISSKNIKFESLVDYVAKNNFTNVTSVQFRFALLTGPLEIEVDQQTYQVYIARKGNRHQMAMLLMRMPTWARFAIPIMISLLFCWMLAKTLSRPLSRMQETAAKIGDGDLSARVEKDANRNDELGDLAKSFNQMASKLEVSLSAHQRLLGDVSHELRSPMTRLQIALALASKAKDNPTDLNKHIDRCELEVTRLDKMVADVLALSRLENTLNNTHFSEQDLGKLVELVCQDAQYLADENEIKIEAKLLTDCVFDLDSQLLVSAISNVLNNAVKYSPRESVISLTMEQVSAEIHIAITDNGEGVPEHALIDLFKPFYRVADARDRKTGGTGLGLAIAKQAISAHQGSISARNASGHGLVVTISLPMK